MKLLEHRGWWLVPCYALLGAIANIRGGRIGFLRGAALIGSVTAIVVVISWWMDYRNETKDEEDL
jgi:hypothetical protein